MKKGQKHDFIAGRLLLGAIFIGGALLYALVYWLFTGELPRLPPPK